MPQPDVGDRLTATCTTRVITVFGDPNFEADKANCKAVSALQDDRACLAVLMAVDGVSQACTYTRNLYTDDGTDFGAILFGSDNCLSRDAMSRVGSPGMLCPGRPIDAPYDVPFTSHQTEQDSTRRITWIYSCQFQDHRDRWVPAQHQSSRPSDTRATECILRAPRARSRALPAVRSGRWTSSTAASAAAGWTRRRPPRRCAPCCQPPRLPQYPVHQLTHAIDDRWEPGYW